MVSYNTGQVLMTYIRSGDQWSPLIMDSSAISEVFATIIKRTIVPYNNGQVSNLTGLLRIMRRSKIN